MGKDHRKDRKRAPSDAWVKRTRIYQQWEERRQEIDEHKWYASERAGHDIGWDRAAVDWLVHYGPRSLQHRHK